LSDDARALARDARFYFILTLAEERERERDCLSSFAAHSLAYLLHLFFSLSAFQQLATNEEEAACGLGASAGNKISTLTGRPLEFHQARWGPNWSGQQQKQQQRNLLSSAKQLRKWPHREALRAVQMQPHAADIARDYPPAEEKLKRGPF